ncbi:hypothetical protein [Fuchsiella alkaliacetigena]|uniref:hypothetical protein n=1 Tax=Fuchsiella alkaliacetigena TaxID=957042 RepID=UPI00200B166A|nr:hypothetical protein [Fuchsiella alkaliacetigena]MCK8823917.1 hypothetical protein [Fuchsiella alkaliacetigena]
MSSKIKVIVLVTLLVVCLASSSAFATARYGTRAYSMGGAFTAVADDASAIYWNPAGLAESGLIGAEVSMGMELGERDFFSDARDIFDGSEEEQINALKDLDEAEIRLDGMGVASFKNFGIGILGNNHFEGKNGNDYNLSNTLNVEGVASWGTTFMQPPLNLGSMAFGVNLKGLRGRYDRIELDESDAEESIKEYDATAKGYGLDVGALFEVTGMFNAGLSIKNATSNLSWDWENQPANSGDLVEDSLERTVTVGGAADLPFPVGAIVAADIEFDEDGNRTYRYGAEKSLFFGLVDLRAGMYDPDDEDRVYTGGLGVNVPFVNVNFAMDSESYYTLSARGSF